MNVLIIGSGGREHALAWKIAQSSRLDKLYVAPGNAGTAALAENVPIGALEFDKLIRFAREKSIDLTVVGPDDPLSLGVVDAFTGSGLRAFGPTKAAAQIEASKAFSKALMQEAGVPTADFKVFREHAEALAYVRSRGAPIVVKASGLALGKGAYVCESLPQAESALKEIMIDRVHKEAGDEVVIEEFLDGPEISVHALCDGEHFKLFPASQDHKAVGEGGTGKNTGGMGTIAPVPLVSPEMMSDIAEHIVAPTLQAMATRGAPFSGLLYPGLKLTARGPKVLEFNARFGDPETQVYMRLLEGDVLELFEACVDGSLGSRSVEFEQGFAANIVLASGGYPDAYKKGLPISGIEEAESMPGVVVFHAGTKIENGQLVTSGGRVLGVSAVGPTLKDALDRAYAAAAKIQFEGKYLRRDIGATSL